MKDIIETLKKLHIFDRRRSKIERKLRELPPRLEEIEASTAGQRSSMQKLEIRKARLDVSRKQKQDFLDQERQRLEKLEGRQMLIKNEKELNAITREIDASRKIVGNVEEEVLRFSTDMDELDAKIKEFQEAVEKAREASADEIADIERQMEEARVALAAQQDARKKIGEKLDPVMLGKYERVRRHQGFSLAVVKDDLCHACHMHIPPQIYNLVQRGEEIQLCPSCHRILVLPDEELLEAEEALDSSEKNVAPVSEDAPEAETAAEQTGG